MRSGPGNLFVAGLVSFAELVMGLSWLFSGSKTQRLKMLFDVYDVNGSGKNGGGQEWCGCYGGFD